MALNTFGWTPAEVTTDSAGNVISGVTLTVFTDVTKATQVTGLMDKDGVTPLANNVVVSDNKGRFGFKASDAYSMLYVYDGSTADPWPIAAHEALDAGMASHAQAVADAQAAADSAAASATEAHNAANLVGAPADVAVKALVDNAASQTRASLGAAFGTSIAKRGIKGQGDRTYALATSATPQQARWVGLGDSVANLKMRFLFSSLNRAYGGGMPGAAISAGQSGTGWGIAGITTNVTTGTVTGASGDFDAWFSGYVDRYATGATRTYGIGGVSPYWDSAKVYYVTGPSTPDGGTFKVQVDGVDEGATVNTNAASIGMGIINITRGTVAQRELKVVNLTGAHRVIGVSFTNSKHGGLIYSGISQGGISLATAVGTAGARANLGTFLADFQPDVITLECKEDSSYYATALETLFGIIDTSAPKATVIGIGTTPVLTGDADQVIQNGQLRAACDTHGNIFWDGYAPFGDYATLNALGWAGDGTHVDDKASAFLAGLMIADLALLDAPGMKATRDNDMTNGRVRSKLDIGPLDQADAAALANARFQPSSGFDLDLILKRTFNVMGSTGVSDAYSWTMRPDGSGDQQIPNGIRVGANVYLQANNPGILQVMSARGGGAARDLKVRALIPEVQTKATQSGAVTVDLAVATVAKVNLTGNMTSFGFTNPTAPGQRVVVWFVQDATGGRTAAGWSGSIVWNPALGAPTLSVGANKRDRIEFEFLDGGYYEIARTLGY